MEKSLASKRFVNYCFVQVYEGKIKKLERKSMFRNSFPLSSV